MAVHTVLVESEYDRLGVVHRVGRRCIDGGPCEWWQGFPLLPCGSGVHGSARKKCSSLANTSFTPRAVAAIVVGGTPGTMVVRIVQNDQGSSLPPDLVDAAPSFSPRAEAGELVTLIDIDHFVEGDFDADPEWVVERAYEMHAPCEVWK